MKTIEEVIIVEEPCDQNVKSHGQVEKIAPLKQVTDQKNEYQPEEKEVDQKIKNYDGNNKEEDQKSTFGSQSDQEKFADLELNIREWADQEAAKYLQQQFGGVPRTQPDGYYKFPDYNDQEDPFATASDQEELKDHALSQNTWTDQAAEDYLAKTEGSVPRTQLSGYITVPDQHHDQDDQPEYTVHQENQQEEVPIASTDGKIKKTKPRGVQKVPDQKEDDINCEDAKTTWRGNSSLSHPGLRSQYSLQLTIKKRTSRKLLTGTRRKTSTIPPYLTR